MALKKKERVLTQDELKIKLNKDFAPFWINSEVLFGPNLFPVSDAFSKKVTLLFLFDIADFTTEKTIEILNLWAHKYINLQWGGVLVFQQKHAFLKNPKFFERYKNQKIFIDSFGELFKRFGSENEPVAVVLKNGEFVSSIPLNPNFSDAFLQIEQQLQVSLRTDDLGLPLPFVEKTVQKNISSKQQSVTPENVSTFGEWSGSSTMIMTEKNGSILSIPFKGKKLRLLAMAHPNSRDPVKVSITFNEKSVTGAYKGSIIHEDMTGATAGQTIFELNKTTGIYDLINSENELTGVMKLTFLNTYDNPAIFYEFRIAS